MGKVAGSAIVLLGLLAAAPAFALLSPFPLIAQYESSFGHNLHNPTSSASGIFGEVDRTWQADLAAIGGDPAQYPSAYLAPNSVQFAVTAYALKTNGFNDWTCPSCNPPLAAALARLGGPSAFDLANLSANPNDYTYLDSPTALAQYFQNNSTGGGGSTLTQSPPAPPANASPSASALSFQWVYDQIINGIMGQIDTSIQSVEKLASKPATTLLALAIAVMGVMTLIGNMDMAVFLAFAIRAAIVMAFVQVGNTFYSHWVEDAVLGIPPYFVTAFSVSGTGVSPAQLFDQILNGWFASVLSVWHSAGWSPHALFIGGILVLLTILIVIPTLAAMFTVFLISTFLLLVMLTIGPIMILALLFQVTRRFFHGYINVLVTGAIFALVVDIVLGIFANILTGLATRFTPSGSPDTDMPGLFGLAAIMLVTGFSMTRLPRLVEAIGGGVAVSMDTVGRFMAGGFAAEAGAAAAAIARRVA